MLSTVADVYEVRKSRFVERLIKEGEEGKVDFDIFDFLREFNTLSNYYTTSSCSGRIMIINAFSLSFAKGRGLAKILAKWHRPVTLSEVLSVVNNGANLWLLTRGPILHVVARNMESAVDLSKLAKDAGFKRSSILSIKDWGVVIEIESDDRLDIPIKINGNLLFNNNQLNEIINTANETLMFGKLRLVRLIKLIESRYFNRSYSQDNEALVPYRVFRRGL
ncbi:tRNA-wybutosine modification methyltransferase TYW3 [Caldivirga maquilingensis]|uniref:tRNA(Phe) 7-((3-amino-3-carboxypropyl)-4-demethylwyosine(37)-N(4))-methyltransferase n=1 Tax=Caldivirga maquilingensis (strain ATCC 700844 / DSM 13496 / JCM 10307 / IC-167) TaxID=397948 RepID=A8MCQ0_CALMQ|nr:hypothetical protein [Caldivirga maquilingensis]ABW01556.1 Protein of unknown function DUF207 [Caldivirga maquilingensis IC-167]